MRKTKISPLSIAKAIADGWNEITPLPLGPAISLESVKQSFGREIRLPNRWRFVIPHKWDVIKALKFQRDDLLGRSKYNGTTVRGIDGKFSEKKYFIDKLTRCVNNIKELDQ
jgi:hypothetical protein